LSFVSNARFPNRCVVCAIIIYDWCSPSRIKKRGMTESAISAGLAQTVAHPSCRSA
jgi:hypothetical protein